MRAIGYLGLALVLTLAASGCTNLRGHERPVPSFIRVGKGYDTYVGYDLVSLVPLEIRRDGWIKARYITAAGQGVAWFNSRSLVILESNPHVFVD